MRKYRLTLSLVRAAQQHAPPGSRDGAAVDATIHSLIDEAQPLPGPKDTDDLPVPFRRWYARPVKGTDLAVVYELAGELVIVHSVRLAAW